MSIAREGRKNTIRKHLNFFNPKLNCMCVYVKENNKWVAKPIATKEI